MTDAYTPSPELAAAITAFDEAQKAVDDRRRELRAAIGKELTDFPDVTSAQVADHVPWSDETVRGIAREHGVPLKRAPTVRSIKPQKRSRKTA